MANNSIDVGVSSINFLTPTNVVIDGDTNAYTPISSPTIDVTNNIYQNDDIIVETTITNYDEIGVGELIAETFIITTTPLTNTTFASTSSSVLYSFSINSSDNPFTGNGQDNYTAVTSLSGGFDDNMDSHMYPVYHNSLLTPTTQRSQGDDFWSGVNNNPHFNHGPSGNIFWQQEADDYEDGVFSLESQFLGTLNYTNNANGWQMGPPSAGQPWFYAGTGVTAGYRGFIWDGIFEGNSTVQPTLTLPGNRDADGTANDDLLLGQTSTVYPNARNNTMFNGEEVKISFYFKHDPDLNENGANTYSGPNGNTPRFVQILLYDGIPGEGGTPVNPDNILDTASLPTGVTSPAYATYSQAPSTSTYQLGYQTNRFVSFAEVDSTNNKLHVAYFKFTNENEVEGICVDDLQVGFRVMNGDDGGGDRIYGYTYGNLGSVNIEKVFRLEECFTETTTSTSDGNPVPDAPIPAFTTVTHSLPNWSLSNPGGPLDITNFISAAITEYGTEFSDLTTFTLTQSGSGATAPYVFPTSGNEDNGTTTYNTVADGTYTTDDKLNIDIPTYTIVSQSSLSLLVNDWYFVDLIYNSYTPGTSDTVIKSPGNNTAFELVQTDIHGTLGQNVLRAIFKIDYNQQLASKIEFAVSNGTTIEIEEVKLIQINDPMTGGNMTHWNFNTDPNPSQHSFDVPSLYGSDEGIQFNVISPLNGSTIVRSIDQSLYQRNVSTQTSLVPTNDGYELKFTITNYELSSGALQFIVGNGNTNNGLSPADHGALRIGLGGTITQDGDYSVEFNFSDDMSGYDVKRDGASTGDVTASANAFENKILIKNGNSGFIGSISDISLIDLTNYFTGAGFNSFNVSGFDQDNNNYIDFEDLGNNQSQIVFNNSPILGGTGDQIQIEQLIEKSIRQEEMYRLVFDYNISVGSIGVYYFSSLGNKGFKRIDITGSGTFNELITINEDHAGSDLLNTLVFFVNEDNTTGTIDNIVLRQEFLQAKTSTLSFSENAKGWVSKKSFIPEQGVSISNEYFTMDKGSLYEHNSNIEVRNTFYGKYEPSTITAILNQSPSSIKSFNTLNYEGSQSNIIAGDGNVLSNGNTYSTLSTYNLNKSDGWSVDYIKTDKQEGSLDEFIEKEGKWFNYIKGLSTNVKTSDLSFQGLGIVKTIN